MLVFATLLLLVVSLLAGDQLFGITGMIFWYAAGLRSSRRLLHDLNAGSPP